jgi:CRISPR-associated endonuclease Csn1
MNQGNKFNVGYVGKKKTNSLKPAKGTNLFFAIYVVMRASEL